MGDAPTWHRGHIRGWDDRRHAGFVRVTESGPCGVCVPEDALCEHLRCRHGVWHDPALEDDLFTNPLFADLPFSRSGPDAGTPRLVPDGTEVWMLVRTDPQGRGPRATRAVCRACHEAGEQALSRATVDARLARIFTGHRFDIPGHGAWFYRQDLPDKGGSPVLRAFEEGARTAIVAGAPDDAGGDARVVRAAEIAACARAAELGDQAGGSITSAPLRGPIRRRTS
jgi:hypothetical protein